MNLFDIIILAVISAAVYLAVKMLRKNGGKPCSSCGGNCECCHKK